MKIISINVNGLKSFYEKGSLSNLINEFNPDILCMQETKCSESLVGYYCSNWNYKYIPYSTSNHWKRGYAGVTTWIKEEFRTSNGELLGYSDAPIMKEYGEGRIVITRLKDFNLVNVYTLNSGEKDQLRSDWDTRFSTLMTELSASGPLIIIGDFNVVSSKLDYWKDDVPWDTLPGLKYFELEGFYKLKNQLKLIDSFRNLNPESRQFSWFSYRGGARQNNRGWRLDYALVEESLINKISSSKIYSEFEGSDHRPIELIID